MTQDDDRRREIETGSQLEGLPGAMWRLLDKADVCEIERWFRGELVRGTPQVTIFDCVSAFIASSALQVAGRISRTQMRQAAQAIMIKASELLERDIAELQDAKKQSTVLRNNIRVVE